MISFSGAIDILLIAAAIVNSGSKNFSIFFYRALWETNDCPAIFCEDESEQTLPNPGAIACKKTDRGKIKSFKGKISGGEPDFLI